MFRDSAQVGIMINGLTVDNLLVGGPAYSSKKMGQGDVILQVDSVNATEQNIRDLLVGNDTPGAPMDVVIAKGGNEVQSTKSTQQ